MDTVIDAAIINDNKILLVKKKDVWMLPGGKLSPNESDLECLTREIAGELSGANLDIICYYGDFYGIATHQKYTDLTKVYLAYLIEDKFRASSEISEAAWVDDISKYTLSDTASKIISALKKDEFL